LCWRAQLVGQQRRRRTKVQRTRAHRSHTGHIESERHTGHKQGTNTENTKRGKHTINTKGTHTQGTHTRHTHTGHKEGTPTHT
jgi:hypothetical protein